MACCGMNFHSTSVSEFFATKYALEVFELDMMCCGMNLHSTSFSEFFVTKYTLAV